MKANFNVDEREKELIEDKGRDPWPAYARCTNASCRLFQPLSSTKQSYAVTLMLNYGDQLPEVRAFDSKLKQIVNIDGTDDIEMRY